MPHLTSPSLTALEEGGKLLREEEEEEEEEGRGRGAPATTCLSQLRGPLVSGRQQCKSQANVFHSAGNARGDRGLWRLQASGKHEGIMVVAPGDGDIHYLVMKENNGTAFMAVSWADYMAAAYHHHHTIRALHATSSMTQLFGTCGSKHGSRRQPSRIATGYMGIM